MGKNKRNNQINSNQVNSGQYITKKVKGKEYAPEELVAGYETLNELVERNKRAYNETLQLKESDLFEEEIKQFQAIEQYVKRLEVEINETEHVVVSRFKKSDFEEMLSVYNALKD